LGQEGSNGELGGKLGTNGGKIVKNSQKHNITHTSHFKWRNNKSY